MGTNDVSVIVDCAAQADAETFVANFRKLAPRISTVAFESEGVPNSAVTVTVRYAHTCKNRGNHYSDARRFAARALAGVDGELDDLIFHGWTPV